MRHLLLWIIAFSSFSFLAIAQETPSDPGIFMKNIWSPYCKGVSLLECPSSQAEDLREEIYSRAKNGEDLQVIVQDLNQRYGPILRMSPGFGGREGLAYWLPWIIFGLIGVGGVSFWLRRRVRKVSAPLVKSQIDPVLEKRMMSDLKDSLN